jgi:hypothetical protein
MPRHTVYFLIEIADEIILSSAGLIATHYFDWSISQVSELFGPPTWQSPTAPARTHHTTRTTR